MTRLINKVAETTKGRRDNNGRPLLNFIRIAIKWYNYLADKGKMAPGQVINPEDVSWMMVEFKICRAEHSWQEDNVLDSMGYEDCLDDMHQHMMELGYSEGVQAFADMEIGALCALRDRLIREVPIVTTTYREGDEYMVIDMSGVPTSTEVQVFDVQEELRQIHEWEDQQRNLRLAQGKEARDNHRIPIGSTSNYTYRKPTE